MSHVPKRVTQHGVFTPSWEVAPTQLKPGQLSLQRQLYSDEAKTLEETYIGEDMPRGSTYKRAHINPYRPIDYTNPAKPMRPQEPVDYCGHRGTSHWRSEQKSVMNEEAIAGAVAFRQINPSYQAMNPPTCVGGSTCLSTYNQNFGLYGSDPHKLIGANDTKNPVYKGPLTHGTAKGTQHIPGYQGFLATNTCNPRVARVENGGTMRNIDKSNLTAAFHTNTLGYSGHKPLNAANDRGGVRLTTRTTTGAAYQPPPL